MLKVKKQIPFKITSFNEKEYLQNQNDIKNSLKNLYIGNKNKQKTIDEYAQLVTQVREDYAKLQNKCLHLEQTLQKYKKYIDDRWQRPIRRNNRNWQEPLRKRKYYNKKEEDEEVEEEDDGNDYNANKYYAKNDNIRYVKPQNNKKRRIVYVDEVDENEDDKEEAPQDPEPQEKKIKKTPTKKNIKN